MCDHKIALVYGAVLNGRANAGWIPMVWSNGRPILGTWHATGFDREEAAYRALVCAEEEAGHYVGDWDVTISRRAGGAG